MSSEVLTIKLTEKQPGRGVSSRKPLGTHHRFARRQAKHLLKRFDPEADYE